MSSSYHAATVEQLGQRLAAGQFPPGSALKVEADLCQELGVSRTILREAIKTLAAKGMLEVGPKVGTRVLPLSRWNLFDTQVVGWLATGGLPAHFVKDLLDLRHAIEPAAVRWACERATPEQVRAILDAYQHLEASLDGGDYNTADQRFHECVLAASHNQFIEQMVPALGALLAASFTLSSADPAELRRTLPLHKDLANGIAARDAARAVWACMMLIDSAAVTLARYAD